MSVQVMQPKKDDTMSKVLKIGAMAGGALATGGTSMAMLGGGLAGGAAFDAGSSILGANNAPAGSSAMDRRAGPQMPAVQDPVRALEDARVALASQPPEMQQQYGAPIMSALLQARRQQGVA